MPDKDDIINILNGGDLSPELWPNSFKYENYKYPTSGDRLNLRRLILADSQIAHGFASMGHAPPIAFFDGAAKCLDALTAIIIAEYKEKE